MPTTYTDQFFIIDPFNPPPPGTAMNFVTYTFIDQNDDGDIDAFDNDSVNGFDVTSSWPGDVVNVNFVDIAKEEYMLSDMRALVLNRKANEGHLTWLDCDSLFWIKLLKLLAYATGDSNTPVTPETLLRGS